MADYISPPFETEPDDLSAEAFDYLEGRVDGWLPNPGNLETWLVEALAQIAGVLLDVASAVPASIFRYFGASILNLPPYEPVSAAGATTWTMRDALGYTIPQGTLVGIPAAGDDLVAFEVAQDTVIAPGATTAEDVSIVAQDAGTDGNGLAGTPTLIDALDFVTTVTLSGPTAGGVEAEADSDYLNRLRALLQLMGPRPIRADDFAVMARQVPGVFRATAIDNYNAATHTADVARAVTVVVVGEDGEPVAAPIKDQVLALLESRREVNFLVFVIDPTYTDVDVTFTLTPYPDFDAADVIPRAEQAVADYLHPANFGAVPYGETPLWLADDKVRYLEVAEALNRVEGVWHVDALAINGGQADVALAGPGPMPRAGTVEGAAS